MVVDDPLAASVLAPDESGKVRPALDAWLTEQADLPAPLVAAARSLSSQVDLQPTNSPLWGRLSTILVELVTPQVQATAWSEDMRRLHEKVAIGRADEEWRAAKYREAVERGDPLAESWERVVPIGCTRGQHSWRRRRSRGVLAHAGRVVRGGAVLLLPV